MWSLCKRRYNLIFRLNLVQIVNGNNWQGFRQNVKIKLPDNSIITGIVSENPIIAQNDPNGSSITKSEKKLIVVRVVPTQNISEFYKIHNLPVDVFF